MNSGLFTADDRRGPDVRLRDIAELIHKTGPDSVDHYDLSRLIDVLVTPMGNDLGRVATDIEETLKAVDLPKDVVVSMKGEVANCGTPSRTLRWRSHWPSF